MRELSDATKAFLAAIASPDVAVRQAALKRLPPAQDAADALPGLAELMAGKDPAVAKAAKAAMEAVTHRALAPPPGKDRPDRAARERAAAALTEVVDSSHPRMVRAHALFLLGFAGDGAQHEKALALLEKDPEVGEDARMARQRLRSVRY